MMPNKHYTTIDQYIENFPGEVQKLLQQMRQAIHEAAPEATEAISYQMPTFKLHGNLVHFAAFKNHTGFFPLPSGVEEFKRLAMGYATTKGAIQFPFDKPIPLDLVKKVVLFRIQENLQKLNSKKT